MTSVKGKVDKTIIVRASAEEVWAALTRPELIKLWMSDEEISVESEWRLGAQITFKGSLHGMTYENKGTITEWIPVKKLAYTFWSTLSQQPDLPENYSVITCQLTSGDDGSTILNLIQSNFIAETTFRHSDFYWHNTLEILKRVVETKRNGSSIE